VEQYFQAVLPEPTSDEKTNWEKNHARDWSCFAQYRNNGFAAHRR